MAKRFEKSVFLAQLAGMAKLPEERAMKLARASIQELAYRVVQNTPVFTGFLRASWQPTIGQSPKLKSNPKSAGGKTRRANIGLGTTLAGASIAIHGMKAGDIFWMVNGTAYAARLEFGFTGTDKLGRNYDQRGRFFVRDTLRQFPAIVREKASVLLR
jgi:hypothetical protein